MKNNKIRFYKVICKCGHVGRKHYIPIPFAVRARNGKEAALMARYFPRVKHDRKDAVLSCKEISEEEYQELNEENEGNPYLYCKNIQEQREHPEIENQVKKDEQGPMVYNKYNKSSLLPKYREWKYRERFAPVLDDYDISEIEEVMA